MNYLLGFNNWHWFKMEDLFDIKKGKRLTKHNMDEGETPFIGSSDSNNAWTAKIGQEPNHSANTITVNYDGSVAEAFYQPQPFWALDSVNVLYPKFNLNPYIGLFLTTIIRQEKYRFNYGRKWHVERMNKSMIYLPVDKTKKPDWIGIEQYIKSLEVLKKYDLSDTTSIKKSIKKSHTNNLETKRWKWFEIQDLFEIKKGKRLTKADMNQGATPFIGSIDSNNGYREYIDQNPIHSGNTITVNYNGSVAEAFYQPKSFWASDDVNVLYPKFTMNSFTALFIVTVIKREKYRFNYGRKWHVERMETSKIKLPITESGKPDFDFMTTYIQSLPYSTSVS
jgi:hypothetical protein